MSTETNPQSSIFINYRREDTRVYADMLYSWLSERYGEQQVFKDVDTIELGLDFDEAIDRVVAKSDVMLVVIGRDWVTDANGRRRLEDPEDYVRKEIQAGLARNIRVIPILVESATMPSGDDLPEPLAGLTRRQAFELNETRLRSDRDELLRRLDRLVRAEAGNGAPAPRPEPAAPPPHHIAAPPQHITAPPPPPRQPAPTMYPPPQQPQPQQPQPPQPYAYPPPQAPGYAVPQQPDRTKTLRLWGWILAGGALIIPLAGIVAIVLGALVISRGQGRRTGAGVGIIATAAVLTLFSIAIWASA